MIRVIAKFDVKPNFREAFVEGLLVAREGSQKETGLLTYEVYVDRNDSNRFFVNEIYEDENAVAYHQSQPYITRLAEMAGTVLAKPPIAYVIDAPLMPSSSKKKPRNDDDPMRVFFILPILEGRMDDVVDRMRDHIDLARQEDGNLVFDVFKTKNIPDVLVVDELWRSPSALWETHFNTDYAQETGKFLTQAVSGDLLSYIFTLSPIK